MVSDTVANSPDAAARNDGVLLSVQDLRTYFYTRAGIVKAVDGVSFELRRGETLGIVGESGSGKTVTALSIMRLIPEPPGRIVGGRITFDGRDMLSLSSRELQRMRGSVMGMIFQDPMTSLNPVLSIGYQLKETLKRHQKLGGKQATERATELLDRVGISEPRKRLKEYPHNFSGGMRQRVVIAMALACNPKLIVADEPTTALDVTIQAQILDLLRGLLQDFDTSVLLITHDLGVVARLCDRIVVMYGGKVLETGTALEVFKEAKQPYTEGLLNSIPRLDRTRGEPLTPIPGNPPNMLAPPRGCPFAPRCQYVLERCINDMPSLEVVSASATHLAACWATNPPGTSGGAAVSAAFVGEAGGR
jgi:oligopeptide transport system ATP-binding protein